MDGGDFTFDLTGATLILCYALFCAELAEDFYLNVHGKISWNLLTLACLILKPDVEFGSQSLMMTDFY